MKSKTVVKVEQKGSKPLEPSVEERKQAIILAPCSPSCSPHKNRELLQLPSVEELESDDTSQDQLDGTHTDQISHPEDPEGFKQYGQGQAVQQQETCHNSGNEAEQNCNLVQQNLKRIKLEGDNFETQQNPLEGESFETGNDTSFIITDLGSLASESDSATEMDKTENQDIESEQPIEKQESLSSQSLAAGVGERTTDGDAAMMSAEKSQVRLLQVLLLLHLQKIQM